jgi:hypothetical protein
MGNLMSTSERISEEKPSPEPIATLFVINKILRQSLKFKILVVAFAMAYWLLYAYSDGILFYYQFDITSYLRQVGISNPSFNLDLSSFNGVYNSGIIWYPTPHIGLVLFMGPTFFSIALAVFFALNMFLLVYGLESKYRLEKRNLVGIAGIIPALFSGGCCVAPLATLLLGSLIPTTILIGIEFGNTLLLNSIVLASMIFFTVYNTRKLNGSKITKENSVSKRLGCRIL